MNYGESGGRFAGSNMGTECFCEVAFSREHVPYRSPDCRPLGRLEPTKPHSETYPRIDGGHLASDAGFAPFRERKKYHHTFAERRGGPGVYKTPALADICDSDAS